MLRPVLMLIGLNLFILGFFPLLAYAQCTNGFCPLAPAPPSSRLSQLYSANSLGDFMNKLFTAALSIGAILAVMRLAWAGYLYMGTDAWSKKGQAKEVIGDVVLGILLLLSIWLILKQINPCLLDLNVLQGIQEGTCRG